MPLVRCKSKEMHQTSFLSRGIRMQYTIYHVINICENEARLSAITSIHPPRNFMLPIQPRAALGGFCYKLQVYFSSLLEVNLKFTSSNLQVFFPAMRSEWSPSPIAHADTYFIRDPPQHELHGRVVLLPSRAGRTRGAQ